MAESDEEPMRVLSFQAMMELPKVPKGEAPAIDTLHPPLSDEDWDEKRTA